MNVQFKFFVIYIVPWTIPSDQKNLKFFRCILAKIGHFYLNPKKVELVKKTFRSLQNDHKENAYFNTVFRIFWAENR
jgi:hypothetical protein